MRLKDLKKYKDEYCVKYVLAEIDCLKKFCKIKRNARVYYLDQWQYQPYFLYGNTIYVADFDYKDKKGLQPKLKSLYSIKLDKNFEFTKIITDPENKYTIEDFKLWYESPVQVNEFVNVSNKKAIEFLQQYNKNTFKAGRYLFYIKRDNDTTWSFFIYAKDLKLNVEVKIYVENFHDYKKVFVDTLTNKLSKYQQYNIKKAFISYYNDTCKELNAPNYYAIEFVKQCIQPTAMVKGWFVRPVFLGDFEFENIFVDDFLSYDKKPYFIIANGTKINAEITRVAALDFFTPSYKSTDIYVAGVYKRLHWDLDKDTIEKLIKFLNQPFDFTKTRMYQRNKDKFNDNEIDFDCETNWQWLISEFNANCCQDSEELPLDLPMPDYTKLIKGNV
jgi:hypothetical protein